jgi:acetyl esterase/lipase
MAKAFAQFGLDNNAPTAPITVDAPLDERRAFAAIVEEGIGAVLSVFGQGVPDAEGVTTTTTTIPGDDGNDVTLYVSRPHSAGAVPALVHLHGGGMAIGSATDANYVRLREYLAATGLVVVGVEFRNSAGTLGPHPYPAGLNDCAAAVRWVSDNRRDLGVSHLVVNGESGGGNLTLSVAHKAKREGWVQQIAGFYANCPFISNRWYEPPDDLPSLRECDGYFISLQQAQVLGSIYNPDKSHWDDPACFAGVATDNDLTDLPPHVISVNELDPMRDEGLDYYRRLLRAGVPAVGRMVAGTCHGGDLLLPAVLPEVFNASVRDLSGFAKSFS